jgi:hypothetical protein
MRVYQFRHVGIFLLRRSALPLRSAIILAFEVLRQTNFRYFRCRFACQYAAVFFASGLGSPRKTKIIAEHFEMSKLP